MGDRTLSDEEARMWRSAMRHVRPLSGSRPQPVAHAGKSTTTPRAATRSVSGHGVSNHRNTGSAPQDRSGERRVRRGRIPVSASFDLHGHSQESAWRILPQFLEREQARGARCVIVITGKGKSGDGVLRRNFLRWLELPEASSLVSGYAQAHSRHGGSGAWYVFLRQIRDAP